MKAISVLSQSSGTEGMIGGQIVDINSEGRALELGELLYLESLKTGAIIRSSGVIGALMSGASQEEVRAIDEYCLNLGIAFQIQDDVLDVTGNEENLGKPIGSDDENQKTTFVSLCGIEKAKDAVNEYSKKAVSALEIFGNKAKYLYELADYLINRNS